jgi:hypothetical protein
MDDGVFCFLEVKTSFVLKDEKLLDHRFIKHWVELKQLTVEDSALEIL